MLHGDLRVDPVQLIQTNPVEAQPPQARFTCRLQMFGRSVFDPLVRTRPLEATLCGKDDVLRIRIQSLSNDALAYVRTIRICSVKEIDSEFRCASHDANGLTPIRGFAPDSLAGEPHRTQSEPSYEEIVADQQFAAEAGRLLF